MMVFVCMQRRWTAVAEKCIVDAPIDPDKKGVAASRTPPESFPVSDPPLFLSDDEDDDSQPKRPTSAAATPGGEWVPTVWVDEDADEDDERSSLSSRASVDMHLAGTEPPSPELPFGGSFESAEAGVRQQTSRLQPYQKPRGVSRAGEMTL